MTLRIEYQFDATSFKKFFENLENNKIDEIAEMVRVIEILEEEDAEEELIKEAQSIISKYLQIKNESEHGVENIKILEMTQFIAFLEKTIKEFEEILKIRGFSSMEQLVSDDKTKIFKVKVWSEGVRYRFSIISENIEKREFDIFLKNGYESHGKN